MLLSRNQCTAEVVPGESDLVSQYVKIVLTFCRSNLLYMTSGTFERLILRREENFERRDFLAACILAVADRTTDLPNAFRTALMRPVE